MRRSILLRTFVIVTAAMLVLCMAAFTMLHITSYKALKDEAVDQASVKLDLLRTYLINRVNAANEYIYQFMNISELLASDTQAFYAFFIHNKPRDAIFTTRVLLRDGSIIGVDSPNVLGNIMTDPAFYQTLSQSGRLVFTAPYYSSLSADRVVAIACSHISEGHETVLIGEIRTRELFNELNSKLTGTEALVVLNDDGSTVFFSQTASLPGSRVSQDGLLDIDKETRESLCALKTGLYSITPDGKVLMVQKRLVLQRWSLFLLTEESQFYNAANRFNRSYIIFIAPSALLLIAICIAVSASVTSPVKKLTRQVDSLSPEDPCCSLSLMRQDEIGRLANSFNGLLLRLRQAYCEKEEMERNRYRMEYKVLQSQIQPHFLFNVHMCIDSLLEQGQVERARSMLSSLDMLLRHSIDSTSSMIPLQEEIEMLQQYFSLQKERMGNRFDTELGNWQPFANVPVPRMLIQPIVENAIRHGLSGVDWRGLIDIQFEQIDEHLHIFVKDNGCGISEEKLQQIEQGQNVSSSQRGMVAIGLSNVRSRIKNLYDESCGLYISARENLGTTVEIVIEMTPRSDAV